MGKIIYCYWRPRGLGNPIKMLMEYGGIEYEFKPVMELSDWLAEKCKLGLDFPNLPYIIDGDVKMTQSWAICRYLAKKVGLHPSGDVEERQADELQGVIEDIRAGFSSSAYRPNFYESVDNLRKSQEDKIGRIEKYLEGKKFLIGEKLTYLDFALYETLDHHRLFFDDILVDTPNIQSYMKRIEALDKIDAYFKSDRFKVFPITGPLALWGGKDYNDKK